MQTLQTTYYFLFEVELVSLEMSQPEFHAFSPQQVPSKITAYSL